MNLFNEIPAEKFFGERFQKALTYANRFSDDYISRKSVTELVKEIQGAFGADILELDLTGRDSKVNMRPIDGRRLPPEWDARPGQSYSFAEVRYKFDIKSGSELLNVRPSDFDFPPVVASIEGKTSFNVYYQTKYANIQLSEKIRGEVKAWISNILGEIKKTVVYINSDVEKYNKELEEHFTAYFNDRKEKIQRMKDQENDLSNF